MYLSSPRKGRAVGRFGSASVVVGAAILGTLFFLLSLRWSEFETYQFTVEIKASRPGQVQLYYDRGGGGGEDQSLTRRLRASGRFELYRFPLDRGVYRSLRLDPNILDGSYEIRKARIVGPNGYLYTFSPYDLKAAQQIARSSISGYMAQFDVIPGGTDPAVLFDIPAPIPLTEYAHAGTGSALSYALLAFAAAYLVAMLARRFAPRIIKAPADRALPILVSVQLAMTLVLPLADHLVVPPDGIAYMHYFDPYFQGMNIYQWPGKWSPLLPFITHFFLFDSPQALVLLQTAILCMLPVLVYRILRRLTGQKRIAFAGGLAFTLLPFYAAFSRMAMTETLGTALNALLVLTAIVNWRSLSGQRWFWTGLVAGLAVLARHQTLLIMPVFLLAAIAIPHSARWRRAGAFATGVALLVLCAIAVNYKFSGEVVFTTSYGPLNRGQLLFDHFTAAPEDRPFLEIYREWRTKHPGHPVSSVSPNIVYVAQTRTGLSNREVVSRFNSLAVQAIIQNPGEYLALVLRSLSAYCFEQAWMVRDVYPGANQKGASINLAAYDRGLKVLISGIFLLVLVVGFGVLIRDMVLSRRGPAAIWARHGSWIFVFMLVIVDAAGSSMIEAPDAENARYWIGLSPMMYILSVGVLARIAAAARRPHRAVDYGEAPPPDIPRTASPAGA